MTRIKYLINGQVQGVGFRPFIYKLALDLKLLGFVNNSVHGVELELQGELGKLEEFEELLYKMLPPLARIDTLTKKEIDSQKTTHFEIMQSTNNQKSTKTALVPPDIAICKECLDDIKSSGKYYDYFATNCTNCGPRYSIIKTVPYDRKETSMQKFSMCNSCLEEYTNPLNRRYHAQPLSCNSCGPRLSLWADENTELKVFDNIYERISTLIKDGNILAIKGIGGFHIVCDSSNDDVVKSLRKFKNRPSKPFAIMCKNLEQIKSIATVNKKEEELLESKESPIVILKKSLKQELKLSKYLAPNIDRIGCFLPYSGLHHLLFEYLDKPIVSTSANLGNEPIITTKENIFKKLNFIDFVVDFDRDIINGVDDSLLQIINNKTQVLRLSRGYAPKVIKLPFKSEKKILAVGANAKNSIAFIIDDNIIISPHIGDLDSLKAFEFFTATIETFKRFYDFEPDIIVHDKHPSYQATSWAKEQGKELVEVQHHLAHIYACKAEHSLKGDYLGFSFDGTGYGDDGTLWGGEVFVGNERRYSFKAVKLLGGEKAIKEPRRVALSMLFDKLSLDEILSLNIEAVKSFSESQIKILHQSHIKNLNVPLSSSVGRIFDAMASFANLLQFQTYEGEAGLICEQHYNKDIRRTFEYRIKDTIIDIEYDFFDKEIVSIFINTLVKVVIDISKKQNLEVILSGGVFQNKTLLELLIAEFKKENIRYHYQQVTAINDGGVALGQAYYILQN